jgi:SAM-dependent methyltransferase
MTEELKKDILQWDVDSWNVALVYWEKHIDFSKVNTCLELGGREGGLSLWLALKGKQVVCSDLSEVEKLAGELHQRHAVKEKMLYQSIDAINIPYENHFDVIVFKSIIGGIGYGNNFHRQQQAFHEMYKALKPGGKLLFAENLIASPLHRWFRKKFVKWGAEWRYVTYTEMNLLLENYSDKQIHSTGVLGVFGRTSVQRKCLAWLDRKILNKILPKSWHYIVYGIATK